MQLDPGRSEHTSTLERSPLSKAALIAQEENEPASRPREGLPSAFRMRHGRHYVEQVMGDAPLRTVREIPVEEIELPPEEGSTELVELERSIREIGVLEPLLVSPQGGQFQLISGANRLRAALNAGLRTVPCLIHEVDGHVLEQLRVAAKRRVPHPLPSEPAPPPQPATSVPPGLRSAFSEVTDGLSFISALFPALDAAGDDQLRWTVLTDLIGVELYRARAVASATEVLSQPCTLTREDIQGGELLQRVLAAVRPEARLRGVRIQFSIADADYEIPIDARVFTPALAGLLKSMMVLVRRPDAALRIAIKGTTIRPALIIEVAQDTSALDPESVGRFFDPHWSQHPCGPSGALMLACLAAATRLHGGRTEVRIDAPQGCTVMVVVPRPTAAINGR